MMNITNRSAELVHDLTGVDDNVHLLVERTNGALGTFASDRISPTHHFSTDRRGTGGSLYLSQLVMSGTTVAPLAVFSYHAFDEFPSVSQENAQPRFGAYNSGARLRAGTCSAPARRSFYMDQMRAFAQLLRGETTLADGVHNIEVMHAAYTAQNERRWMDLPQPAGTPWILPSYS
ncbi:hypothetical protein ACWGTO_30575 [Mesorhizobium sp. PL10]